MSEDRFHSKTIQNASNSTLDAAEVARFDRLAETWWDEFGPMRTLHKFNPVRIAYVRDHILSHFNRSGEGLTPLSGLDLLDIGCGGGLLCEPLARLGANVTGIDPASKNIGVARLHAGQSGLPITYQEQTIEAVVGEGRQFDIVMAMEVVEHVADVDLFVKSCCQAVKPGGLLFMATLNRTLKAFALAIVGAEYVLGWLPRGTHQWDKFVTPQELRTALALGGFAPRHETGVVYNPLRDQWRTHRDMDVNYMLVAAQSY
jgi:2-polyprenyl-6-hydroxyphenyl methylase / 3-demethylubiquinone-9 3-methyltransferase